VDIVKKRTLAKGVVARSVRVQKQGTSANGIVAVACRVGEQREAAACGVVHTGGVAKKRSSANGRIVSRVVERKRPSPETSVESGVGEECERIETKR
jgi:hypothetical protein